MFGELIPGGLLSKFQPLVLNLIAAPITVVFIHRWLAIGLLLFALVTHWRIQRQNYPADIMAGIHAVIALVVVQVGLGILVIVSHIEIALALIHQANAIALFCATVYLLHRFRAADGLREQKA